MKYNIEKLTTEKQENKYLFFWGHQPNKDGSISKTCFSQWWLSSFDVDGITYKTAEHWMMAKKHYYLMTRKFSKKLFRPNLQPKPKS
jgi:predicted NAD-dependent protein-ADP-ribosyltransferase YbiA (DUF1768 family)